ncbi:MAG TPA: TadE/TadG family type IV pilus assembly protein [Thermomicrobiaceae bacterium]|nr:TadE/TadG family type IV pilus assembly protein [Thermomicrobiaceae bacterium]
MRQLRRHGKDRGQLGQGMVELAVVLPLLLVILLGTIDLGRAFYTYVALTNAAREAARYAAVNDTNASSSQVLQEFTASNGSDISGCASGSLTFVGSGGGRGNDYTVTVSCQFTLVTPLNVLLGAAGNQVTISSTATFVWE